MTIDFLTQNISAVRVNDLHYDLYEKELRISLTPEYGIRDKELESKEFVIIFIECSNFEVNVSETLDVSNGIEFISWGKVTSTGNSGHETRSSLVLFQFENMFGDSIQVSCKEIKVKM